MWTRRLSELAFAGWLGLVAFDARAEPGGANADDSLAAYRERFKQGMDLYQHGAAAEAIACWEPIYRDLGGQRGYRLAYDLGIAYAALDDAPHAAVHLQAFVDEVDSRRGRGEALGAVVTKEESDARARLALLAAILGAHAAPEASASPGPVAPAVPVAPTAPATPTTRPERPPAPIEPMSRPPFPPSLIAVSGGVTLAAVVAAVALEVNANNLHDRYVSEQAQSPDRTISAADRASFATARTWAYVAVGGATGLAGVTGGLVVWYVLGRTHRETAATNAALAIRIRGSGAVLEASF
jgi:hypothetical protein